MIQKEKSIYHVSLKEAKKHLRIDPDFTDDDSEILDLIQAAHQIAEDYIEKDITQTINVLTRRYFSGSSLDVTEGNLISITAIETEESAEPLENLTTYIYRDRFSVEFDEETINTKKLTATFLTGYAPNKCPRSIKTAIKIKIGDLYDIDRASSVLVNVKPTGIFETLLTPYKAILFDHEPEN